MVTGPPPVIEPPPQEQKPRQKGLLGLLATVGLVLAKWGQAAFVALKAFKGLALLKTGGSMIVTAAVYSLRFGWPFAIGFVLTILIHEMGHVLAAAAFGVPVTAPVFIPFMGAFILEKEAPKTEWASAVIGIGGPIAGTLAGLACLAIFGVSHNPFFLALANVTFLLNLFNLTPVFPLDGGWIVGAISPYFWILGILLLVTMFLTGFVRNPFVLVIVILAIPQVIASFKRGSMAHGGMARATPAQKAVLGVAYLGLVGLLALLMGETHAMIKG